MLIPHYQIFLPFLWASSSVVFALPADSPADSLAKLEGRAAKCSADLCYGALTNKAALATPFCTSYIQQTPGTVTVTKWATSSATPATPTVTALVGTITVTTSSLATATLTQTNFDKRAATTPIASIASSSCTSKSGAPVTARISSACSCLLSTSATTTITSTTSTTLPVPKAVTQTTSYASTSTIVVPSTTTIVSVYTEAATCASVGYGFLSNDIWWSPICNTAWWVSEDTYMNNAVQPSFKSCVSWCASTDSCMVVNFKRSTGDCTLMRNTYWPGEGYQNYYSDSDMDCAGGEF